MKKLLLSILLALPLTVMAAAEVAPGAEYYKSGLSFDAFGSARTYDLNNARTGTGLGVNFWLANNIGFGAEGLTENTSGDAFVDYAQGNLLWRITSGRAALNLSAGAGYDFEKDEIYASAGGGPEYALTRVVHGFFDARAVKPIEGGDIHALFRLGLRLAF